MPDVTLARTHTSPTHTHAHESVLTRDRLIDQSCQAKQETRAASFPSSLNKRLHYYNTARKADERLAESDSYDDDTTIDQHMRPITRENT